MPAWSPRSQRLICNAALVALALYLSLAYARIPGRTTAIWLATGVEVGFLLRMPRSEWRASLVIHFLLTVLGVSWSGAQGWTTAIGWPVVNTLGCWLTALLLARDPDWVRGRSERLASWLRFALIGGLLMPALWGLVGGALLMTAPSATLGWASFSTAALGRFVNNALSIFVLVPMFVRLEQAGRMRDPGRLGETLGLLGLFSIAVAAVFMQRSVLPLFALPLFVLVLLFRLEFVGTVASMVILLLGAIALTLVHKGPFSVMAAGNWPRALLYAQCYLLIVFATIVLTTGLLAERQAMAQRTVELATESARMKSAFLAKMSHEIRTPLNAILGFAELLRHDAALSADQQQSVRIINESGNHLLGLINEVLDMAKIDAGQAELASNDIDLPAFLQGVVGMMTLRAERKGLSLTLRAGADLPHFVHVDELKLRQVFLNLLGNAIKFTERGEVRVEVDHAAARAGSGDGELRVAVSDTGPGIAAAERSRLFTAFHQGQAGRHSQGGTGLGLMISKSFIELMGGRIAVESTLGQGSRFSFSVKVGPAARAESAPPVREAIGLAADQRRPNVLVVDDVEANRLFLARLMNKFELPVVCVDNGLEAVAAFAARGADLVWMDLAMPEMSGDVAMRRIRGLPGGAAARIVCVTADAFSLHEGHLATGFDEVVLKPVNEARLVAVMQALLGLEFIYRDAPIVGDRTPVPLHPAADDAELLAAAPTSWRRDFHGAVITGDIRRMQQQLDCLPASHVALRARLQTMLDLIDLPALAALDARADLREPPSRGVATT